MRQSLGRTLADLGRDEAARDHLRAAHAILTELGDPSAAADPT